MNENVNPETSTIPTCPDSTGPHPSILPPLSAIVPYLATAALTALGMWVAMSASTPGAKTQAPATAPAQQNRQVTVVHLYGCQYLAVDNPFFMVHHGGCTNRLHYVTIQDSHSVTKVWQPGDPLEVHNLSATYTTNKGHVYNTAIDEPKK